MEASRLVTSMVLRGQLFEPPLTFAFKGTAGLQRSG
jgi:hypothetical protein